MPDQPELPFSDDGIERPVSIESDAGPLEGTLGVRPTATGIVVFAHGSGSSRFSPRNRYVARVLRDAGLGTLLLDLLSRREEQVDAITREYRFDISRLADRLVHTIQWLESEPQCRGLGIGLFGASTGGGAALVAAARRADVVQAVVSRGGRPDLAGHALPAVQCPTLLIVGEWDAPVIEMNEHARQMMRAAVELVVVPRATHLFEEPGALDQVAALARDWFLKHLRAQATITTARSPS